MDKQRKFDYASSEKTYYAQSVLLTPVHATDCVPALVLKGSPYEKGYAYGMLMTQKITEVVSRVCTQIYALYGGWIPDGTRVPTAIQLEAGKQYVLAQTHRDLVPAIQKETPSFWTQLVGLYEGLRENGSPVDFEDLLVLNTSPESVSRNKGCSNFAAWGDATQNGELIHGINMDYDTFGLLHQHIIAILEVQESENSYLGIGFVGCIAPASFINTSGVSYGELTSNSAETDWPQLPHFFQEKSIAIEAKDIASAFDVIQRTGGTTGFNNMICQTKPVNHAAVVECAGALAGIRFPDSEFPEAIYATNFFNGYPGETNYEGPNLIEGQVRYWATNPRIVKEQFHLESLSWKDVDTVEKWRSIVVCERFNRYKTLLKTHYGSIDVAMAIAFQGEAPICKRGPNLNAEKVLAPECMHLYGFKFPIVNRTNLVSLYSLVMEPSNGTVWVAAGNEPAQDGHYYGINLFELLDDVEKSLEGWKRGDSDAEK